jgi:hypothetical protein
MNREEILNMPAGREMDKLIYDKILGYKSFYSLDGELIDEEIFAAVSNYSTDISAAWEVVEKMIKEGFEYDIEYHPNEYWPNEDKSRLEDIRWRADFCAYPGTDMCHNIQAAPTAPLAICRAALLAVMEE